jgi:hypothetical protein
MLFSLFLAAFLSWPESNHGKERATMKIAIFFMFFLLDENDFWVYGKLSIAVQKTIQKW